MKVTFEEDFIIISDYPYKPSSIYPAKKIHASEIVKIAIDFIPPTMFLKNHDVIFLMHPSYTVASLEYFSSINNIPLIQKHDVWSWILTPFLDSKYEAEDRERDNNNFLKIGLDLDYVEKLRSELKERMMMYNFGTMLWEYLHLGLSDVFRALSGELTSATADENLFKKVYWEYCRIAHYGWECHNEQQGLQDYIVPEVPPKIQN